MCLRWTLRQQIIKRRGWRCLHIGLTCLLACNTTNYVCDSHDGAVSGMLPWPKYHHVWLHATTFTNLRAVHQCLCQTQLVASYSAEGVAKQLLQLKVSLLVYHKQCPGSLEAAAAVLADCTAACHRLLGTKTCLAEELAARAGLQDVESGL